MSQSYDNVRMLGASEIQEYIPMYAAARKRPQQDQYVIKDDSRAETRYISFIGTRRNYTTDLEFALTFRSKQDAERGAIRGESVCLLSEESRYQ